MIIENVVEIVIALDIAILSIAYPIIVDKVSNIGDKYSSEYIETLFKEEFPEKRIRIKFKKNDFRISYLKISFYITLGTFIPLIFKFSPPLGCNIYIINNSAKLIVLISSTISIIFFFRWLDLVAVYNGKSKQLLKRIIYKYNKITNDETLTSYYLKSINEITLYSIEKQDEHLQKTLLNFYKLEFVNFRKEHDKSKPLIYKIDLYTLINKLNYQLANSENKKLLSIEHRAVSGVWLLGEEFENYKISENTYNWLWSNLCLICDKNKYVRMYWGHVSNYFNYRMELIYKVYDSEFNVNNHDEFLEQKKARERFLEFHYAFGGLLLYRKQYKSINYLFNYTQSEPPTYPLLPNNMTDIFSWYEHFNNDFKNFNLEIDSKYIFPEIDNLGSRKLINEFICNYLCLLFIRQYSLQAYYVHQSHTSLPTIPDDINELKNWQHVINHFNLKLNLILQNQSLIEELGFTEIIEKNKHSMTSFFVDLSNEITKKLQSEELNAELEIEKVKNYLHFTNEIISKAFTDYDKISSVFDSNERDPDLVLKIIGRRTLISKSAFTRNDNYFIGYESVFAEHIAKDIIQRYIPSSFLSASNKYYLVNKQTLIDVIGRIISNNSDENLIIAINIEKEYESIIKESKFASQLINIPATGLYDVMFIIKKEHLPSIEFNDVRKEDIKELQLVLINPERNLFASVIDINRPENLYIKEQWKTNNQNSESELKVQLTISFNLNLFWKKNRNIIQINLANQFNEFGIISDLNEIDELN